MNKKLKVTWMVALMIVAVGLLPALSLQAQEKGLCCVAGKYEGFQLNYAKPNCPKPVKEKFTMLIKQKTPCTSVVGGTITDSSGLVNNWTGTLSRGLLRGCCVLEGSFVTPGGNTGQIQGQYLPEPRQVAGQGHLGRDRVHRSLQGQRHLEDEPGLILYQGSDPPRSAGNEKGVAFRIPLICQEGFCLRAVVLAAGRLQTRGVGSAKPVADNASELGRAQNRRVKLVRQ